MKYLLLDFDGVLNDQDFRASKQPSLDTLISTQLEPALDPVRVHRVNQILLATGAWVVVTSNWASMLDGVKLRALLEGAGLQRPYATAPQHSFNCSREDQVLAWVEVHVKAGDSWCVLDDLNLLEVKDRLVRCLDGIEDQHVDQAIDILGYSPRHDRDRAEPKDSWLVCIVREQIPEVVTFTSESAARRFYDLWSTQWSESYLTKIVFGPHV